MSAYTHVKYGLREGQVKLWNSWEDGMPEVSGIQPNDSVPEHEGHKFYSVAMREGGYLHIVSCIFEAWSDKPMANFPVFDKWGDDYVSDEVNLGLLDEPYRPLRAAD